MSVTGAIVITGIAVAMGVAGLVMSWRLVNKLHHDHPSVARRGKS